MSQRTRRRRGCVRIPVQNKAYAISQTALVQMQKPDPHTDAPTGHSPWMSRMTPMFCSMELVPPPRLVLP